MLRSQYSNSARPNLQVAPLAFGYLHLDAIAFSCRQTLSDVMYGL